MYYGYYSTPIGILEVMCSNDYLMSISFVQEKQNSKPNKIVDQVIKQLDEYFNGIRRDFDIPLFLEGTDFQKSVWNELTKIKYGNVCTYKDIAINIGNNKACRAVGNANNKNKIPIIIPCHRVVGVNNLCGYAGGVHIKEWLINFENSNV